MKRSAHALLRAGLLALALMVVGSPRSAAAQPDTSVTPPTGEVAIPKPSGFMNDLANVLLEDDHARLEGFLDQVHRKTGAEFGVLIVQTTAPLSPTEYKTRVFDAWKLGKQGEDNGLLMLVALDEHEVRFETGYGLEGALPDGLQSRIFRREMAPRFQQGDVSGGVREGVLQCAAIIAKEKGVTLEWDGRPLRYGQGRDRSKAGMLVALVIFLIVVFALMRAQNMSGPGGGSALRRRRRRYGSWFDGGGGGWGGGFGGGGFGGGGFGGGGSFGGGGGGGGSFGGFGGGSSGGGGGGGKW